LFLFSKVSLIDLVYFFPHPYPFFFCFLFLCVFYRRCPGYLKCLGRGRLVAAPEFVGFSFPPFRWTAPPPGVFVLVLFGNGLRLCATGLMSPPLSQSSALESRPTRHKGGIGQLFFPALVRCAPFSFDSSRLLWFPQCPSWLWVSPSPLLSQIAFGGLRCISV